MSKKIGTISNHIEQSPDDLKPIIEALKDEGYKIEGPKPRKPVLGVSGEDYGLYYWVIKK